MAPDKPPGLTRRQLLQATAVSTGAGLAGCMGDGGDGSQPGVTIIEERSSPGAPQTPTPRSTVTAPTDGTETATEDATTTDADTETATDEATETATEEESEPTETEEDGSGTDTSRQLRIISAAGSDPFDYAFTVDGDAELVTTGEYNAVPKEETADDRGEEIVENDDGTVTIRGVVADGGGDTFRITGDIVDTDVRGEAKVYVDGDLVLETEAPGITGCVTIDEPGEYVLTADVSSAADVCIDIRADDVRLDGDGHTLSGSDGAGTGISAWGSNVRIENVTVRGFEVGIEPEGARVAACEVTENGTGIQFVSPGSVGSVVDCEVSHNEQAGIDIEGAEGERLRVRGNRIESNGRHGIWAAVADVDVHENVIEDNGGWGVHAVDGTATLDSNEIARNDGGIYLVGQGTLDNETIADNRGIGAAIEGDAELWATSIRDNDGEGLSVQSAPNASGSARLERCQITGNAAAGILATVELAVRDSTIAGNAEYGVRYAGEGVADARNNFWGAADGPSSPADPDAPFKDPVEDVFADGAGDAVSEGDTSGVSNVRFAPWRESEG